jgi:hypothetical protein
MKVIMLSDEFGLEEFDYDTEQEAREGFERLKATCQASEDGIERHLFLAIDTWTSNDDDTQAAGPS